MTAQTWINLATVLLVLANLGVMLRARRASYRAGWLDGRVDLLQHMAQAQQDGLDFPTFIRQVAARDGYLIPEDPESHA